MQHRKVYVNREIAENLGWKINVDSRYRLDEHKQKILDNYKDNQGVLVACKNVGVNPANVPYLWLKNSSESVKVDNPHYVPGGEGINEDYIKECLLKEIKAVSTNKEVKSDKTLIIYVADSHIGLYIDSTAPISSVVLNYKDSLHSLLNLIDQPFKEVVIVFMGDIIDSVNNQTSRGGHTLPSSMTTREMFETFIEGGKSFFNALNSHPFVGAIRYYSVAEDNHTGSVNSLIMRAFEIWLNAQYPEIITQVFTKTQELFEVGDHKFLILHGKDAKNQFKGHPLVLTPKTESFFMNWFLSNGITPNYKNTHIVKGDLHCSSYQLSNFFSYLNCLSMQTGSNWQQSNFMGSLPGVTYSIVSNNGITNGEYFL